MTLQICRSRHFHWTLNRVNPSSGFRAICSGPWAIGNDNHVAPLLTWVKTAHDTAQLDVTSQLVSPSSSFRDMHSAKSGPHWYQIWQDFLPMGTVISGKWPCHCTSSGLDDSAELPSASEIYVPQYLCHPEYDNTPPTGRADGTNWT